jgi:glycosyltransferase involved in cell wall biosynthesis
MHFLHLGITVAVWCIALAWMYKLIEVARGLPTVANLIAGKFDNAAVDGPSVTVIVPARNEAAGVGRCLLSLIDQEYRNLRIIGVDDRSTDQTGAIMDALAQADKRRLEVLRIAELPAGWLGKTNAMACAARYAIATHKPDYLLFTDADIVFSLDAIRRAVAQAEATQADHFVVLPTTVVKTRGEGMLLAYLQVIGLWAVRLWRVADPKAMRDAIGVGAFNLIRSEVYQRLGGFEAAPMEILEDLSLGRRVKRAGLRQRVAFAPGMVSVHWAPGVLGIVNGMGKNFFALFRFRPVLLLGAALWTVIFCVGPAAMLAIGSMRVPAFLALASVAGLYQISSRSSRISSGYFVLFPFAALLVVYAMVRSMVIARIRGGVTWRGTFYPLGELRSQLEADELI